MKKDKKNKKDTLELIQEFSCDLCFDEGGAYGSCRKCKRKAGEQHDIPS